MKALYDAVRNMIFPNGRHAGQNSYRFAEGGEPYSAALRLALVAFENANRGHRDLLNHPEMDISANTSLLPHSLRRADRMRATLGHSLSGLFQFVISDRNLPETPEFTAVLDAQDALGYIPALLKFGLKCQCETEAFTAKTAFDIERLRLEQDGSQVVMHVRIRVGMKEATRAIPLGPADITTLRGARSVHEVADDVFESWFRDVSRWPEFQPEGAPARIEVFRAGMSAPIYLTPDQATQLELTSPSAASVASAPVHPKADMPPGPGQAAASAVPEPPKPATPGASMTHPSQSCVDAASGYANGKEHEGAGFHLRLVLKNGNVVEGAVCPALPDFPGVVLVETVLKDGHSLKEAEPTFVEKSEVVSATVIW